MLSHLLHIGSDYSKENDVFTFPQKIEHKCPCVLDKENFPSAWAIFERQTLNCQDFSTEDEAIARLWGFTQFQVYIFKRIACDRYHLAYRMFQSFTYHKIAVYICRPISSTPQVNTFKNGLYTVCRLATTRGGRTWSYNSRTFQGQEAWIQATRMAL